MNPFGPMLGFELARVARRQRLIAGRAAYVLLLLVLLGFIYLSLFNRGPDNLMDFLFRSSAKANDLANFGMAFFMVFTFVQYFIATFSTASASASIMAEEMEKNTLPFLLTTTLADREIVLGKLGARVAQVLMLLAAGLPVLAIMQVMGGIDPVLLWASFLAIFVSIISTAGLGAAISVRTPSVKAATGRAVGIVAAYTLLCPYVSFGLSQWIGPRNLIPNSWGYFSVGEIIDWLNSGNLIWLISRLVRVSGSLNLVLPEMLTQFCLFHLVVAALTGGWTAWRLRKILARQQGLADKSSAKKKKGQQRIRRDRRPVSQTRPVYWRETTTNVTKPGQRAWHRWFRRLFFLLSFFPLCTIIYEGVMYPRSRMVEEIHNLVRGLGTMVLCITCLRMALAASAMLGRERRKKTMDELCLTSLTNREILKDKAWACLSTARWPMIWIAIHWAIDLFVGGMNPLTLIIVPTMVAVFFLYSIRLGIMCSAYDSQKMRAGAAATLGMLVVAGLPWIPVIVHALWLDFRGGRSVEYTAMFAVGMSPPSALAVMTLGIDDLSGFRNERDYRTKMKLMAAGLIIGLLALVFLSEIAWRRAKRRFARDRHE